MTFVKLVHVIDDDDAIRRSAAFMLKASGYAVLTWATGAAFLKELHHIPEGCILLDVRMPGMDGLEVQQALSDRGITMSVIVMTGHGDVSTAVKAMKGGAVDFLEKPFERAALLSAISSAFERAAAVDGAIARSAGAMAVLGVLTPREREVLEGLARGLPNKTIAYDLGISPRTVEVHRANLMSKLNLSSLSAVLRLAFSAGIGS